MAAFRRGLLILDYFLSSSGKQLTASEVARVLDIHPATALRFLATLESSGHLEPSDRPNGYRLGAKWRSLGSHTSGMRPVFLVSVPILRKLTEETGEGASLGVLYRGEVVLVHVVDGPQRVQVRQLVGVRCPAHLQALGKVLLAGLNEAALEDWFQGRTLEVLTPNSIASPQRLRAELAEVRQRGYAVDEDEYELGLTCIGAPVRDAAGITVAAVAVSGPSSRISYHRIPILAAATRRAGERLSRALYAPLSVLETIDGQSGTPRIHPESGSNREATSTPNER